MKINRTDFLLLLIAVFLAWALEEAVYAKSKLHGPNSFKSVTYLKNYDGDTITVNIPGVHGLLGEKAGIRVNGVDTPEMRTKDACEKRLGKITQEVVEDVLKGAKNIDLVNVGRGKYFRIVADVIADGVDLKTVLFKKGLAVPYDGGTKQKVDWCKMEKSYKKGKK